MFTVLGGDVDDVIEGTGLYNGPLVVSNVYIRDVRSE